MCYLRLVLVWALFLISVGIGTMVRAEEPVSLAKPVPVAHFPGMVFGVSRQVDGSAVCTSSEGVFLAVDDFRRWSAVSCLPREYGYRPVGGNRKCLFIERTLANGEHSLLAANINGTATIVRSKMPMGNLAAFSSRDVGVVTTGTMLGAGTNLVLTADGGATWNPTPPLLIEKEQEDISALLWVSSSRLLVGSTRGSVQLVEHKDDGSLRRVWSATVRGNVDDFALDGDDVWVNHHPLYRLTLANGHVDAIIKADVTVVGMTACHQSLLTWDRGGPPIIHHGLERSSTAENSSPNATKQERTAEPPCISVWIRDPKLGYVRRATLPTKKWIAGALPLEAPLCLVVTVNGEGLLLDLDKCILSSLPLRITPLPPPSPSPANPNLATTEELQSMVALARRAPLRDREVILGKANKMTDLTPRQRVKWATQELRRYIETNKKLGPVVDIPATVEDLRTSVALAEQVPEADRNAIALEAAKQTDLTERDRVLWITQQYRQYLEHHKPKPEEKKRPAGENNTETSPAQAGRE